MKLPLLNRTQLGQVLRSARRARHLSQAEVASRIGISQSRLSALELDPRSLSFGQLSALLALYELDLFVETRNVAADSTAEW